MTLLSRLAHHNAKVEKPPRLSQGPLAARSEGDESLKPLFNLMGFFQYNTEPQPLSVIKIYGTLVRWHTSVLVIERRLKKEHGKLETSLGYRMIPCFFLTKKERPIKQKQ